VRHSLNIAASYDIPTLLKGRLGHALTRRWSVDAIVRARTATPVDLTAFAEVISGGLVEFERPDLILGVPVYLRDSRAPGGRAINPAAFNFDLTGNATNEGSLGRNALRGFGLSQVDAVVRRKFSLTQRVNLQLRAEIFNLFNHPNFANPSPDFGISALGFISNETLGQSLGNGGALGGLTPVYQIGGARTIQLGIKLQF
jgi:hypothetical protein